MFDKIKLYSSLRRSGSAEYVGLPNGDEKDPMSPNEADVRRLRPSRKALHFLWLVVASLLGASISTFWRHSSGKAVDMLTCGTTNEEAKLLGCVMEPMVYGWIPKPCYFPELSNQYTPFEDRDWYLSEAYLEEERIPSEDLWSAKHSHIFTRQYHGEHCLFLWRKLNRAVWQRSKWLDHKTLDVAHTDHCVLELEDHGIEYKNASNDVVLGFYRCLRLDSL